MPLVSLGEMMSMVDKWEEVEQAWATEHGCGMAEVSACTIETIRELLPKHDKRCRQTITIARAGLQVLLRNTEFVRECLVALALCYLSGEECDGQAQMLSCAAFELKTAIDALQCFRAACATAPTSPD